MRQESGYCEPVGHFERCLKVVIVVGGLGDLPDVKFETFASGGVSPKRIFEFLLFVALSGKSKRSANRELGWRFSGVFQGLVGGRILEFLLLNIRQVGGQVLVRNAELILDLIRERADIANALLVVAQQALSAGAAGFVEAEDYNHDERGGG